VYKQKNFNNILGEQKKPNVGFVILSPCHAIALATADLTLSRKAKKLFYLLLPTFVRWFA